MQPYEGVQFIGVIHTRRSRSVKPKNGGKIMASLSLVTGKEQNACAEAFHGNHPSAIIIDDQGIIRGRWDGWSPRLAEIIRMGHLGA